MKNEWSASDIGSLAGRTVVITGANSGIGEAAASQMAALGATVTLAVRDAERGRKAVTSMDGEVRVAKLDLADLSSVRQFADSVEGSIDLLINNAGVMAVPLARTADGFEMQIGTNHLGHFALTNLLLPKVTDRVVTVSSSAHRFGRIDFEDFNWERRRYQPWAAYGQSKLSNLLMVLELQRRLDEQGSPIRATACHPGLAATSLQSHTGSRLSGAVLGIANLTVAQSAAGGAMPTLFAATADVPGASFAGPSGLGGSRG